jgi:hypothetical protein
MPHSGPAFGPPSTSLVPGRHVSLANDVDGRDEARP